MVTNHNGRLLLAAACKQGSSNDVAVVGFKESFPGQLANGLIFLLTSRAIWAYTMRYITDAWNGRRMAEDHT